MLYPQTSSRWITSAVGSIRQYASANATGPTTNIPLSIKIKPLTHSPYLLLTALTLRAARHPAFAVSRRALLDMTRDWSD